MIAGLDAISFIGSVAVATAFIATLVGITAYYLYYRDQNENLLRLGNRSFYLMQGGVVTALVLLIYSLMTNDFQMNYVYSYSSTELSKYYLFATLWAGQEGTFLMWLFYGGLYGLILIKTMSKERPLVMFFLMLVQATLLLILLKKNPFVMIWHNYAEVPINFTPADGNGLNPLLQNPWMVIHPPTLFVGYSSTVVPFVIAMSAMVTRDYQGWLKAAQPWIIFNVMILGTGIIMGGYWAYITLGWGGYWGWDPVENASLVPWIFGLVLLHGVIVQSSRKSLIKTNMFLAGGTFLTMVWGSFLTRSGVLTDFSVHSFAPSGLTFYLVMFQLVFTVMFFAVFFNFARWMKDEGVEPSEFGDGLMNRETFMLMGMLILLLSGIFVLFGTSAPLYTRWFGDPASLAPDFYNTMIRPAGLFMLFFIGIAPLLAWKTSEFRNRDTAMWAGIAAIIATALAMVLGLTQPWSILLFLFAAFVVAINAKVAWTFINRNMTKAGGYIAHVGLGLMTIGIITSSMYDDSEKVMLPEGEFTTTEMGYDIKFLGFREMPDGKDRVKLEVRTAFGSYEAQPEFYYSEFSKSYMVAPDVKVAFAKDIYISPISFTPAEYANLNSFKLKKGETHNYADLEITFKDFSVNMGPSTQEVTANLDITASEGNYDKVLPVKPILTARDGEMDSQPADIPGTAYQIKIVSVSATDGVVELAVMSPQHDAGTTPRDMMAVEVTEKPLISILWIGTLVFVLGSALTLVNRTRQRRSRKERSRSEAEEIIV